jgi:hypothetical protein
MIQRENVGNTADRNPLNFLFGLFLSFPLVYVDPYHLLSPVVGQVIRPRLGIPPFASNHRSYPYPSRRFRAPRFSRRDRLGGQKPVAEGAR